MHRKCIFQAIMEVKIWIKNIKIILHVLRFKVLRLSRIEETLAILKGNSGKQWSIFEKLKGISGKQQGTYGKQKGNCGKQKDTSGKQKGNSSKQKRTSAK